jgi:hypothetical protein
LPLLLLPEETGWGWLLLRRPAIERPPLALLLYRLLLFCHKVVNNSSYILAQLVS